MPAIYLTGEHLWTGDRKTFTKTQNIYQVMALPDFDKDGVNEVLLVQGGDPNYDPEVGKSAEIALQPLHLRNECLFFLGSWGINRSAGQTNHVNREAVLGQFVGSALRFIPHEPRKKDTHSLYLQCFQQGPFFKFSDKHYKFKIPTATGT